MELDVRPTAFECRIYENGGYLQRSKFVGCFNVHIIMDDYAVVSMLHGEWSKEIADKLRDRLQEIGISRVDYEHDHKPKSVAIAFG